MCTLSFYFPDRGGAYTVAMNRDESKSRRVADEVVELRDKNRSIFYPRDADAQGTWIGANSYGLTLALMNHHLPSSPASDEKRSRGEVVVRGMDQVTAEDAIGWAETLSPRRYRPFRLFAIDLRSEFFYAVTSDGDGFRREKFPRENALFASSSFRAREVERQRRAQFVAAVSERTQNAAVSGGDGVWLEDLHRSHRPERGPYSLCMHRDDAESVSLTMIRCARNEIELNYAAGSPCQTVEFLKFRAAISERVPTFFSDGS